MWAYILLAYCAHCLDKMDAAEQAEHVERSEHEHEHTEHEHEHEHTEHTEHFDEDERGADKLHTDARGQGTCLWRPLEVHGITLLVSSTGAIRLSNAPFWNVHYGVVVPGTPYRSVVLQVEDEEGESSYHYMHELVWQAFEGHIPEGWFVGHKVDEWRRLGSAGEVSNALHALELYEKRVETMA